VRRRISAVLLACVAVPAAILGGCGGDGGGGEIDVGPAAAVPQNAAIYLDATVKPTGSAEADARAALGKVLDTDDPGGKIVSLIEKESKSEGHPISYQQDVAPWLGEKAGLFFTDLTDDAQKGAVAVQTTNPTAALAFARKATGTTAANPAPQSYKGVSYQADPTEPGNVFGGVGSFLVLGDQTGFKAAVDAESGDSLGDSDDFKDALGDLPDDRLGTFYTVPRALLASLGPDQIDQSSQALLEMSVGEALDKPVSGALTASADSFDLEFIGGEGGVETPESSLVGEVPGQSWLALGFGNLGEVAKNTIDQLKDAGIRDFQAGLSQVEQATGSSIEQLTDALGDAALYVEGTTEPTLTGALVIQTKDPQLTGRLLNQLQTLVRLGSSGTVRALQLGAGGTGFQIKDPSIAPQAVEIAQQDDKLVIGYGANSAARTLTPANTLSDSPSFSAARGQVSDLGTDFFLDFPMVFKLAESTGAKSDPGYRQAKPYIDALGYLVSGSGERDDQAEVRAVLGLK
jgi:Protein of unknown function (DUF3352)